MRWEYTAMWGTLANEVLIASIRCIHTVHEIVIRKRKGRHHCGVAYPDPGAEPGAPVCPSKYCGGGGWFE